MAVEKAHRSWSSALELRKGLSTTRVSLFQQGMPGPYHIGSRDSIGAGDDGRETLLGLWIDGKAMVDVLGVDKLSHCSAVDIELIPSVHREWQGIRGIWGVSRLDEAYHPRS